VNRPRDAAGQQNFETLTHWLKMKLNPKSQTPKLPNSYLSYTR
jgi:hypothetical protein